MMAETTKIAGFGQYGQRDDGADAGQLTKPRGVGVARQQHFRLGFDLVALAYQAAAFGERTSRNIAMAGESGCTGNAMDDRAVS